MFPFFIIKLLFFNKYYYLCEVTHRIMEQKPITKKQMLWRVSLGVASAILSCPIMWFSHTWIERILAGIAFVCAIISIIQTIRQWKKHPLVDEAVDRELQEEKKGALTAMGGILLLFAFAIFLLILAIRAF